MPMNKSTRPIMNQQIQVMKLFFNIQLIRNNDNCGLRLTNDEVYKIKIPAIFKYYLKS